jgi:hypothetical protein
MGSRSIDGVVSNADASNGGDGVGGIGSLGLGPVVGSVSAAVGVVPGVVGHHGVPEGVVGGAVGEDVPHEAGGEVGLEEAGVEVDPDEVHALVVVLEVEALEVAVVPGDVEGRTVLGDGLLGGVPVLVALEEGGLCGCEEEHADKDGLHMICLYESNPLTTFEIKQHNL